VDILRCLVNETLIVAISGRRLLKGETFTETDQERLITAVGRIMAAAEEGLR
jgi:hypothetical protein